ncbi:MAG: AarF/ABC1/UbiB kinase family protein [Actinomycetota bacterium]|nr:AarF/ABC1/UbiB kinase family protein [Actinomycetota bacterium]
MPEIPKGAIRRSAKFATLPAAFAGRTALGFGKRVGGKSAEAVAADISLRTAEQLFKVLGELKGGAMKFGQAMSIFEAAMPEEFAAPYRETLTKLQDSAPPMDASRIHEILEAELGDDWRSRFHHFDDAPAAAASIGQVHKATWHDGRVVAVKVQYPGADKALTADLNQIGRLGKMMSAAIPGMDIKPLIEELKARMIEELDYLKEADNQREFANAYEGDPEVVVPHVVVSSPHVLVSEWVDGIPLSAVISNGTQAERDFAGTQYIRFLLSGPARVGLLHADPHPGNYRITPEGLFCALDFGAVARLPQGLPMALGTLLRVADMGDATTVMQGLRDEGFIKANTNLDPEQLLSYLDPFVEPSRHEEFTFSREWMRGQFNRINDFRDPDFTIGLKINLPPEYALIHRVWLGGIGVLCQLGATVPMRDELEKWVPGYLPD